MTSKQDDDLDNIEDNGVTLSDNENFLNSENVKIGKILRQLRRSKNLSLDDVVKDICIKKVFLEALEKENFELLPERTYALGYLKVYLNYLEVADVDSYLKKVDDSYNLVDPDYQNTEYSLPLEEKYTFFNVLRDNLKNSSNGRLSGKQKYIILGICLLIVVIICGVIFIDFTSSDEVKKVKNLEDKSSTFFADDYVTKDKADKPTVETAKDKLEPLKDNENDIANDSVAKNKNMVQTNNIAPTNHKVQTNKAEVSQLEENKLRIIKMPAETKAKTIKITFLDKVWLRIYDAKNPNNVYIDKIFVKGDVFDIPGVDNLMMDIADYAKVDMTVSGTHISLYNNKRRSHVTNNIRLEDKYLLNKYSIAQ